MKISYQGIVLLMCVLAACLCGCSVANHRAPIPPPDLAEIKAWARYSGPDASVTVILPEKPMDHYAKALVTGILMGIPVWPVAPFSTIEQKPEPPMTHWGAAIPARYGNHAKDDHPLLRDGNHAKAAHPLLKEYLTRGKIPSAFLAKHAPNQSVTDYYVTLAFTEDKTTHTVWTYFTGPTVFIWNFIIPVPMGAKTLALKMRVSVHHSADNSEIFSKTYDYEEYFTYGAYHYDRDDDWKRTLGLFYGQAFADVLKAINDDTTGPDAAKKLLRARADIVRKKSEAILTHMATPDDPLSAYCKTLAQSQKSALDIRAIHARLANPGLAEAKRNQLTEGLHIMGLPLPASVGTAVSTLSTPNATTPIESPVLTAGKWHTVKADRLFLYSAASEKASMIGQLGHGVRVKVESIKNKWIKVKTISGMSGWALAAALSATP
jgi:Bacterial SH3 domain